MANPEARPLSKLLRASHTVTGRNQCMMHAHGVCALGALVRFYMWIHVMVLWYSDWDDLWSWDEKGVGQTVPSHRCAGDTQTLQSGLLVSLSWNFADSCYSPISLIKSLHTHTHIHRLTKMPPLVTNRDIVQHIGLRKDEATDTSYILYKNATHPDRPETSANVRWVMIKGARVSMTTLT